VTTALTNPEAGFVLKRTWGQSQPSKDATALTRTEVGNLLTQARQAMAAGKLSEAERLVRRAEGAKIHYPVLHFGDTPARVRLDLQDLLRKQSSGPRSAGGSVAGKIAKFNPLAALGGKSHRKVEDPFAAAAPSTGQTVANPFRANLQGKPSTPRPATTLSAKEASGVSTASPPDMLHSAPQHSSRERSDAELLAARRALAVGDVAQAQQHLARAREQHVPYDATKDSPERVLQSIAEYQQLLANQADTSTWRQGYSRFLVEQAQSLIQWGDLDGAERVASEADRLQTNVAPENVAPADVLEQIKQLRQGTAMASGGDRQQKSIADAKSQTARLLAKARSALAAGDLKQAETLAGRASRMNVADSQFAPQEDRPSKLAADLERARLEQQQIALTSGAIPVDLTLPSMQQGEGNTPRLAQAPESTPQPLPTIQEVLPQPVNALELLEAGEQALRDGKRAQALELFRSAHQRRNELDPRNRQQLQDHLQMLSSDRAGRRTRTHDNALLDAASKGRAVVARQISAEIGKRQSEAARLRTSDPNQALVVLNEAVDLVMESELDENTKTQLKRRIELSIAETDRYIHDHQAELQLDESNREVLDKLDRQREVKVQVRQRMAELVDQFNTLRDEQRFGEMEIVAKRLYEMAPEEPVAQQVWENAKFIRRAINNRELSEMSEEGVYGIFEGIRKTSAESLLQADTPIKYDAETWADLVKNRHSAGESESRRSPRELEIERKLRTPVLPRYTDMPLTEVIDGLSKLAGVNIHLDPRGLGQEGVRSDTPITLSLSQEISLKSALNLILEPLHLTYMIKDEVLKITSEQLRDGDVYQRVYNVADLVVPIPNFVPSSDLGLQGLINDAYASMGYGARGAGAPGPMAMVAGQRPAQAGPPMSGNTLAQQFGSAPGAGGVSSPISGGPGGLGGAASADFDSLIDLITSTVEHDSWMENGTGEGEIQPFPTNLSLVVSQTQRVHEQVADLLEQLRRLQDLQVTIEVRFIRLTDSFFERIGIDFDFNIQDRTGLTDIQSGTPFEGNRPSATVGISSAPVTNPIGLPNFTADLDIPFRQSSFGLSTPQFGTPQDIGTFGFAILSDIEAFFLINASQGDRRANVLQAPKVTLFNGQQAIIVDSSFRPFVISVIPVVGEFAAAQQPVIVVLSEGTLMTVQAVVSDDRRYVRLTLVPFFSQIGDVQTFTFEGSQTSSSSSSTTDQNSDGNDESNNNANSTIRNGTTVQLPTFQVISVSTTVSVPDGGTVLLGGIKRMREGRNEFGVPLLSKVPYVDRLFRNVGIGRETDSLMMMVTPHIIIQEEEEGRLGMSQQ